MIDTQAVLPARRASKADKYDTSRLPAARHRLLHRRRARCSRCRSTSRARSSTTTRTRSPRPASTPRSRRPRSTRSRPTRRRSTTRARRRTASALKIDPWYLEQWPRRRASLRRTTGTAATTRATKVAFDNDDRPRDLHVDRRHGDESGSGRRTPARPEGNFDNLARRSATRRPRMTIDTSAALGTISQLLGHGQFPGVELGVAPMPGPPATAACSSAAARSTS